MCLNDCLAAPQDIRQYEEDINVVVDRSREFAHEALTVFSESMGLERIVSVSFADMRKCLWLQAADVLSWEINKAATEHLRATNRPKRKSLDYLVSNLAHYVKFLDLEELQRLKALRG